jgi:putative tricarboxylic transport membrane protein
MKKTGFEPGPLVLAFVLGEIMERAFRQSMLLSGGSLDIFVTRPLSGGLLAVMALVVLVSLVTARRRRAAFRHVDPEDDAGAEGDAGPVEGEPGLSAQPARTTGSTPGRDTPRTSDTDVPSAPGER